MGGDPGDVHAAGAVLDHDEDVEAAEEDGVDVGEADREDRVGLRGQELSPGGPGPFRCGIVASGLQDHRRPHSYYSTTDITAHNDQQHLHIASELTSCLRDLSGAFIASRFRAGRDACYGPR